MSDHKNDVKSAKKTAALFVGLAVVIAAVIIGTMLIMPYDPGTLAPATLSSNLSYGGLVTETDDYIFYRTKSGDLGRISRENGETTVIYEGNVSFLNPLDGFLYFIDGGDIKKTTYFGTVSETVGDVTGVRKMSLNGNWIYFVGQDFYLYKMRNDGKMLTKLSDGCIDGFTADNRVVVYSDESGIHKIASDGTGKTDLADGKVDNFCYTLDDLYYCTDGKIKRISSVVSGVDVGLNFNEVMGSVFAFTTDTSGRGVLFYLDGAGTIHQKNLESERERSEEDVALISAPDAADLFYAGGQLYYHDQNGDLFAVTINGSDSSAARVEN